MSAVIRGSFDVRGAPRVRIHVFRDIHSAPGMALDGPIDTGFSGFLQFSSSHARQLSLRIDGTARVLLANNTTAIVQTASAMVALAGQQQAGEVQIAGSMREVLLGRRFLKIFERALIVSENIGVILIREGYLSNILNSR